MLIDTFPLGLPFPQNIPKNPFSLFFSIEKKDKSCLEQAKVFCVFIEFSGLFGTIVSQLKHIT